MADSYLDLAEQLYNNRNSNAGTDIPSSQAIVAPSGTQVVDTASQKAPIDLTPVDDTTKEVPYTPSEDDYTPARVEIIPDLPKKSPVLTENSDRKNSENVSVANLIQHGSETSSAFKIPDYVFNKGAIDNPMGAFNNFAYQTNRLYQGTLSVIRHDLNQAGLYQGESDTNKPLLQQLVEDTKAGDPSASMASYAQDMLADQWDAFKQGADNPQQNDPLTFTKVMLGKYWDSVNNYLHEHFADQPIDLTQGGQYDLSKPQSTLEMIASSLGGAATGNPDVEMTQLLGMDPNLYNVKGIANIQKDTATSAMNFIGRNLLTIDDLFAAPGIDPLAYSGGILGQAPEVLKDAYTAGMKASLYGISKLSPDLADAMEGAINTAGNKIVAIKDKYVGKFNKEQGAINAIIKFYQENGVEKEVADKTATNMIQTFNEYRQSAIANSQDFIQDIMAKRPINDVKTGGEVGKWDANLINKYFKPMLVSVSKSFGMDPQNILTKILAGSSDWKATGELFNNILADTDDATRDAEPGMLADQIKPTIRKIFSIDEPEEINQPYQQTLREWSMNGGEEQEHHDFVEQAILDNKKVPPYVVADYDDLIEKYRDQVNLRANFGNATESEVNNLTKTIAQPLRNVQKPELGGPITVEKGQDVQDIINKTYQVELNKLVTQGINDAEPVAQSIADNRHTVRLKALDETYDIQTKANKAARQGLNELQKETVSKINDIQDEGVAWAKQEILDRQNAHVSNLNDTMEAHQQAFNNITDKYETAFEGRMIDHNFDRDNMIQETKDQANEIQKDLISKLKNEEIPPSKANQAINSLQNKTFKQINQIHQTYEDEVPAIKESLQNQASDEALDHYKSVQSLKEALPDQLDQIRSDVNDEMNQRIADKVHAVHEEAMDKGLNALQNIKSTADIDAEYTTKLKQLERTRNLEYQYITQKLRTVKYADLFNSYVSANQEVFNDIFQKVMDKSGIPQEAQDYLRTVREAIDSTGAQMTERGKIGPALPNWWRRQIIIPEDGLIHFDPERAVSNFKQTGMSGINSMTMDRVLGTHQAFREWALKHGADYERDMFNTLAHVDMKNNLDQSLMAIDKFRPDELKVGAVGRSIDNYLRYLYDGYSGRDNEVAKMLGGAADGFNYNSKMLLTLARPSFYWKHLGGIPMQMMQYSGLKGLGNMVKSFSEYLELRFGLGSDFTNAAGDVQKSEDIIQAFKDYGVGNTGFLRGDIGQKVAQMGETYSMHDPRYWFAKAAHWSTHAQDFMREWGAYSFWKDGNDLKTASQMAKDAFIDYSSVHNDVDRSLQGLFYFYTFARKNAPNTFRMLNENPQLFSGMARLTDAMSTGKRPSAEDINNMNNWDRDKWNIFGDMFRGYQSMYQLGFTPWEHTYHLLAPLFRANEGVNNFAANWLGNTITDNMPPLAKLAIDELSKYSWFHSFHVMDGYVPLSQRYNDLSLDSIHVINKVSQEMGMGNVYTKQTHAYENGELVPRTYVYAPQSLAWMLSSAPGAWAFTEYYDMFHDHKQKTGESMPNVLDLMKSGQLTDADQTLHFLTGAKHGAVNWDELRSQRVHEAQEMLDNIAEGVGAKYQPKPRIPREAHKEIIENDY